MHETSIALEIHKAARSAVRECGPGRIESVKVAIGELSCVEPELLRYAWQAVTCGSPEASASLEIDWRQARQFCPLCCEEKARAEGAWLRLCQDCGQPLKIEGGDELDLLQVCFLTPKEEYAS